MLVAAEPMYWKDDGTAVAPMVPGARAVARLAARVSDENLLLQLIDQWLVVRNPRLHTDVLQIFVDARSALYENYAGRICDLFSESREHRIITRLIGDLGVLRFPSHSLRLVGRMVRDGRRDLAQQLVTACAEAIALETQEKELIDDQASLALLGAQPALNRCGTKLVRQIFRRTRRDWRL